jgi:hypothetical protein
MTNTSDTNDRELLHCPFCGSTASHYPDGDMEGYSIMCNGDSGVLFGGEATDCPMRTFGYATAEAAEQAWNRRAAADLARTHRGEK